MTTNFRINPQFVELPPQVPQFSIDITKKQFETLCQAMLQEIMPGRTFTSSSLTDTVFNWACNNNGKGLLLWGGCGIGKTFLTRYIIPYLLHCKGISPTVISAIDLSQNIEKLRNPNIRYYVIDDIGTEQPLNNFGVRTELFAELVYRAELNGKLIVGSTNCDTEAIQGRYGERVYSRLKALCSFNSLAAANLPDLRKTT